MKIFIIGSNSFMGTSLLSYFINDLKDKNVETLLAADHHKTTASKSIILKINLNFIK